MSLPRLTPFLLLVFNTRVSLLMHSDVLANNCMLVINRSLVRPAAIRYIAGVEL